MSSGRPRREVAESCVEFLLNEMMSYFARRGDGGPPASACLEAIGIRVGRALAERLSLDSTVRFVDPLDHIKFVCKDVWNQLFKKQVDKLQTNNQGVFLLLDQHFRWTRRIIPGLAGDAEARSKVDGYLVCACGIIKGVLGHFGWTCSIVPDVEREQGGELKTSCKFTITIHNYPKHLKPRPAVQPAAAPAQQLPPVPPRHVSAPPRSDRVQAA